MSPLPQTAFHRRRHLLILVGVTILTCSIYYPSLHNPFVYDDSHAILNNVLIQRSEYLVHFFTGHISTSGISGHTRPLPMITFYLNYAVDGLNPRGYRAVNIALHLLCGLLVFFLVRRLIRGYTKLTEDQDLPSWVAAIAAALFAFHPINSLSVLMVWKRTTLLATLCFLLAVLAFFALRGIGAPPPRTALRRILLSVSIPFLYLLALASKETAITLPAILLLLEFWPRRPGQPEKGRPRFWQVFLLHGVTWSATVVWWLLLFPHAVAKMAHLDRYSYLLVQAKALWFYLAMVFYPDLLAGSYDLGVSGSLDPLALAGGAGILALLTLALFWRKRYPLATLALLWALINLSPTSSFVPGPLLVDEDRIYIPFVMVWLGLSYGLIGCWRRGRTIKWASAIGGLLFLSMALIGTVTRAVTWEDDVWIWMDALRKYPDSAMAKVNLCIAIQQREGRALEALAICRKAQKELPKRHLLAEGVAYSLLKLGRRDEALQEVQRALTQHPSMASLLQLAGDLSWMADDYPQALDYYQKVLKFAPWDLDTIVFLAKTYHKLGRLEEARLAIDKIEGRPVIRFPTQVALAQLYAELGQSTRAERLLGNLIQQHPSQAALLLELALIKRRQGDRAATHALLQRAETLLSGQPALRLQTVKVYLEAGDPEAAIRLLEGLEPKFTGFAQPKILLGAALLAQGQLARACRVFREIKPPTKDYADLQQKLKAACTGAD